MYPSADNISPETVTNYPLTGNVWRHHSHVIQARLFQDCVHPVMVLSDRD